MVSLKELSVTLQSISRRKAMRVIGLFIPSRSMPLTERFLAMNKHLQSLFPYFGKEFPQRRQSWLHVVGFRLSSRGSLEEKDFKKAQYFSIFSFGQHRPSVFDASRGKIAHATCEGGTFLFARAAEVDEEMTADERACCGTGLGSVQLIYRQISVLIL